ncbi:hypothetical protein DFR70_12753 [Nocardia tenerifensis]|uniref:Uncharacterized protein n=1 Tax=Nocardia tenerifensis TaxID=228006 RepID=A0A318JNT3_9NOCA|nr:hypothetical protein [Nocardia tenerifensis]PXX53442.1 hypothetical protein DFR70_12753 [Nocardia tenerifensis]
MDINDDPHLAGDEAAMRETYDRCFRLRQASLHATTYERYHALRAEALRIEQDWLASAPGHLWDEWRNLQRIVQDSADQPGEVRDRRAELLYRAAFGDPTLDTTALSLNSYFHAERLTEPATSPHRVHTSGLAYFATYQRSDSDDPAFAHLTSCWKAREWLYQQSVNHPDEERLTVDIRAVDYVSGAETMLMTGAGISSEELRDELDRLTDILGGERELDGKPFVDELHYDILVDDYTDAVTAANHPHASVLRFEHKLHADDVRDQTLDFAFHLGLNASDRLTDADNTALVRHRTTPAPPTSWLDNAADYTAWSRERLQENAFGIRYLASKGSRCEIRFRWTPLDPERPWYAEEFRFTEQDANTGVVTSIGRYRSPGELAFAVKTWSAARYSDNDAAQLHYATRRAYDWQHRLDRADDNTNTAQRIRESVRHREPFEISKNEPPQAFTRPSNAANAESEMRNRGPQQDCSTTAANRRAAHTRRQRANRQPGRNRPGRRRM